MAWWMVCACFASRPAGALHLTGRKRAFARIVQAVHLYWERAIYTSCKRWQPVSCTAADHCIRPHSWIYLHICNKNKEWHASHMYIRGLRLCNISRAVHSPARNQPTPAARPTACMWMLFGALEPGPCLHHALVQVVAAKIDQLMIYDHWWDWNFLSVEQIDIDTQDVCS